MKKHYLAIDMGASHVRMSIGSFDGDRMTLKEVFRFWNGPVTVGGTLYWDLLHIFRNLKEGITLAQKEYGAGLVSLGIDSWGEDFALLGEDGKLLGNMVHYRDRRTAGMFDEVFSRMPKAEIFSQTGVHFKELNSLYQLTAISQNNAYEYKAAKRLLFVPDLFNYWLTGKMGTNRTMAGTSQFYNPLLKGWAYEVLKRVGLRTDLFADLVDPCTVFGEYQGLSVVNVGAHDTTSAVAAVPIKPGARCAFISSGSWSSIGAELDKPVINKEVRVADFTNEAGICGKTQLLKATTGLWIVQELQKEWREQGYDYSWTDMGNLAASAEPHRFFIDPSHKIFKAPGNMVSRIQDFCEGTEQECPEDHGSILLAVNEGLALLYADTIDSLETLTDKVFDLVRIVGGGSRNVVLNQFTANALGRMVISGPIEATAIGNVLGQMLALGDIDSLEDGREIVRNSFAHESRMFSPKNTEEWAAALGQWRILTGH